jgi:hypothetical protein
LAGTLSNAQGETATSKDKINGDELSFAAIGSVEGKK